MANPQPNILFIMSDDHAAHVMSCYTHRWEGRPVINQTPNIDRIANEGIILDNTFCTNSICKEKEDLDRLQKEAKDTPYIQINEKTIRQFLFV
jgi:hypothetical protein